jgi:hypothetical protein
MPVLPFIDLLILMGWTSLFGAFALKAIYITTAYTPRLFGLGPLDLTILAGVLLLFAVALAARAWVKSYEVQTLSPRERAAATLEAYSQMQADLAGGAMDDPGVDLEATGSAPPGPRSAISA